MKFLKKQILLHKEAIAIALITTFGTLLLAQISFMLLTNQNASILDLMQQWDVIRYVIVAEKGYVNAVTADNSLIAVFPLLPALMDIMSVITKNLMVSALIISNVAFFVAVVFLYKLVMLDSKKNIAVNSVLFLSIFPTAYFLHTGYTESLFLALAIPSFYYARKGNWVLASLLGMMSSFARITAVALFFGLLIEYLHQKKFKLNGIGKDILLLGLIPLGFSFYLLISYHLFGNPLTFIENQSYFNREVAPFWEGLNNALKSITLRSANESLMIGYGEAIAGLVGLVASLVAFKYLRPSYAIYMLAALFIVTFNSFWLGTPRYLLSMFPLFILMSKLTEKNKILRFSLIFVSLTLFTLLLSLFVRGWWAF